MSFKNTKIQTRLIPFMILIAILAANLSACTGFGGKNTPSASSIASFDVPDGYTPDISVSAMGYTIISYTPGDGHSHLYLIQSENEEDREKLVQVLSNYTIGSDDLQNIRKDDARNESGTGMTIIETRPVTVRGEETTLVIAEGVNSENLPYMQAMVAFSGNGGPALLVFSEPVERWDEATVETLIASIR